MKLAKSPSTYMFFLAAPGRCRRVFGSWLLTHWHRFLGYFKRYNRLASNSRFQSYYKYFAISVLLTTSLLWAGLGANLQQQNADELADPYLFTDHATFQTAHFPSQHSQLLKWPLFLIIRLSHFNAIVSIGLAMACAITTVAGLTYILLRIERRPIYFGTLCLCLASVLLLVPAQPYAGGLLPVNLAMLASRNIEYLVLIGAIGMCLRAQRLRSWSLLAGSGLLGLLFASDRLFVSLALMSGLLAILGYGNRKRWQLVNVQIRYVIMTIAGIAIAVGLLTLAGQVTQLSVDGGATAYSLVAGPKQLLLAVIYGLGGVFTNLGANPLFDAQTIRSMPTSLLRNMVSPGGFAFIVNISIAVIGLRAVFRIAQNSLRGGKPWFSRSNLAGQLAVTLATISLVAFGLFIMSQHDFMVDARYVGIVVFAVFVNLAVWSRRQRWPAELVVLTGIVALVGCLSGSVFAVQQHHAQRQALAEIQRRNQAVIKNLGRHHQRQLLGDYWRVLPIRQQAGYQANLHAVALANCTDVRDSLTSDRGSQQIHEHSFAYLLSLDKGLTDYPACSVNQVTAAFGRPTSSQLVAGRQAQPKELLLYYDTGLQPASTRRLASAAVNNQLKAIHCAVPTIMNVVAHQDDDLLFLNPDLLHDIRQGHCVRTIYVTAGDDGHGPGYWQAREHGSEAAYARMLGIPNVWQEQAVKLPNNQAVTIASPAVNQDISLIFMRLPDGDLQGSGFSRTDHQSLAALTSGAIHSVQTVDKQAVYSSQQLTDSLLQLFMAFQPWQIRTQSSQQGSILQDHSDHRSTGRYARQAYNLYVAQLTEDATVPAFQFYLGYPEREQPANVNGSDLREKQAAFLAYAAFDSGVCHSSSECDHTPTYGSYLRRQYLVGE